MNKMIYSALLTFTICFGMFNVSGTDTECSIPRQTLLSKSIFLGNDREQKANEKSKVICTDTNHSVGKTAKTPTTSNIDYDETKDGMDLRISDITIHNRIIVTNISLNITRQIDSRTFDRPKRDSGDFDASLTNDNSLDCVSLKCFYHNITIQNNLLPPLLQNARTIVMMTTTDKWKEINDNITIRYELKNFRFVRHTVDNLNRHKTKLKLSLVIFSDTFEDILNPEESISKVVGFQRSTVSVFDYGSVCFAFSMCSSTNQQLFPTCYCDALCTVYGDCCLNTPKNHHYAPDYNLHISIKKYMTCLENEYVSPQDYAGYWVVSVCPAYDPSSFDQLDEKQYTAIKERCEEASDDAYFIPVASTKTGIHYRNAYCALCHKEDDYIFWSQGMPYQLGIFGKRVRNAYVHLVQPPSSFQGRRCFNFTFSECPAEVVKSKYGHILNARCRSHVNPFVYKIPLDQTGYPNFTKVHTLHRNMYCFICNTRFYPNIYLSCLGNINEPLYVISSYKWLFRKDQKLVLPERFTKLCKQAEAWQPFLNKCVKLFCPKFKVPFNGYCGDISTTLKRNALLFTHYIKGNLTEEIFTIFLSRFSRRMKKKLPGFLHLGAEPIRENGEDNVIHIVVEAKFDAPVAAVNLAQLSIFQRWTFSRSRYDSIVFFYIPKFINARTSYTDKTYDDIEGSIKIYKDTLAKYKLDESFVCSSSYFEHSDTVQFETCTFSNLSRDVNAGTHALYSNISTEEIILTYISMGSSSIAIFVTLYRGFKRRSKPVSSIKRMLFHYLSVKLVTQVTFMLGCGANDIELMCYIIGVVLHYLWLASFVWSSICAYFFYYVFVLAMRSMRGVMLAQGSGILSYIIIGYALPLFVTTLSFVVDQMKYDDADRNYGAHVCFITGEETLLYGFAFPVVIMISFNFICLTASILHMLQNSIILLTWKDRFKRYLPVCVKMSVLLSLTWCLGFIATWLDSHVIWLMFITFDGTQGILLCSSFIPYKAFFKSIRSNSISTK